MANGDPTQQPGSNSSGVDGAVGQGMNVSLADLAGLIRNWQDEYDSIRADGAELGQTSAITSTPAGDTITREYIDAAQASIRLLLEHNESMSDFTGNYAVKLAESRDSYNATEADNTASFNGFGI